MRNCAIASCPSCKGSLDTPSPNYSEATEHEKGIWYNCRSTAMQIDFDASEAAYKARDLKDLENERDNIMSQIESLDSTIVNSGYSDAGRIDYKTLMGEDITTGITVIQATLDKGKLMMHLGDINRHIRWKIEGIPENAYRDQQFRENPYTINPDLLNDD